MLTKLYVDNFRCFQNCIFNCEGIASALLIGKNGSGKSTLLAVIELFQKIGQSNTLVENLLSIDDFGFFDSKRPITFEIEAKLSNDKYNYQLVFNLVETSNLLAVSSEYLKVNGKDVFSRDFKNPSKNTAAPFTKRQVGLPLVGTINNDDPIAVFLQWLKQIIVISPSPDDFSSISKKEASYLNKKASNSADWIRYVLTTNPALYEHITKNMKFFMPDFHSFRLDATGKDERQLLIRFDDEKKIELDASLLSNGEKIYLITSILLALIENNEPILCVWDEIDQYIALPELSFFISRCRKAFENSEKGSQLFVTTHNSRVMYEFSRHNTYLLKRSSHLQPSRITTLENERFASPDIVSAYENGELD